MNPFHVTVAMSFVLLCVPAAAAECPRDSVEVGPTCVDRYEASAWVIPEGNTRLIARVKRGKATLAELRQGGAIQVGCAQTPWNVAAYPDTFPRNGNWTTPVYAASVPDVLPTACTSWFQAEQACALSGKRLITNQEWQRAAAGTPEAAGLSQICNVTLLFGGPRVTGENPSCVSRWGAVDMVGNVMEWTGDWDEVATECTEWPTSEFGFDRTCIGNGISGLPGALVRGGNWNSDVTAGVFFAEAFGAFAAGELIGFRCAR